MAMCSGASYQCAEELGAFGVFQGLNNYQYYALGFRVPILWFHIPGIILVYGTDLNMILVI